MIMYETDCDRVYVVDRVYQNEDAKRRLNAMLDAMKPPEIVKITDRELNDLVKERNWGDSYKLRTGNYNREQTPTFIFNTFRWSKLMLRAKSFRYPKLNQAMFLGQKPFTHRSRINHLERNICQAAWEVHSVFGCLHACDYCHVEDFINIMLNIEELIEKMRILIEENPRQQLYKYDNLSDIPVFEPEYDACRLMVNFFSRQIDKYLLLYTKSDNVDYLLDLDHKRRTIINWSISPDEQTRLIEKKTPPLSNRIEAMRQCQESGYTVRARFSPLIPLANWQDKTADMITQVFKNVQPDVITLDIIGFMKPEIMLEVINEDLMDNEALNILNELKTKKRLYGKHVFPHEYRKKMLSTVIKEIQRVSPGTPVSICNETRAMWNDLADILGRNTPENYVCCCGPTSVPGNPLLKRKR